MTRLNVPLLYVPGNHDPDLRPPDTTWTPTRGVVGLPPPGPEGCVNVDGRAVEEHGVRVAGLGGSLRYKAGPNQYSQGEMGRRALRLEFRLRLKRVRAGRKLDVLLTHAAPYGLVDTDDPTHEGFVAFFRLIRNFRPLLAVHGHVHPYGRVLPERQVGPTRVVNAVPSRVIEI